MLAELLLHLVHHLLRRLAHRLHRHRREPVRQHRAHHQASERDRLQDVHALDVRPRHERAEQRQRHQRRRADREALADGRRRVARRVQSVGLLAHRGGESGHLGDAARVIGDGAVGVDGQRGRQRRQHAQRRQRHAVHVREEEREEDGHRQREDGDHHRLVAQRQTADDVRGRAGHAGLGHLAHGLVVVGGHEVRGLADDQTRPQTRDHAQVRLPALRVLHAPAAVHRLLHHARAETVGEEELRHQRHRHRREDRRDVQLDGQVALHVALLRHLQPRHRGGEERGQEGRQDAARGHQQREHHEAPVLVQLVGGRRHHQRGARRFREGSEQIGAHTGHIAHVVAHVIGDHGGVARIVLRNAHFHLAHQIGTHIGRLRVDTAAHTAEQSDRGTAQTVAGDALEQNLRHVRVRRVPRQEEAPDPDRSVQEQKTDGGQAETHHASSAEGGVEAVRPGHLAHGGSASVRVHSNHHTNVSAENRGRTTEQESQRRETAREPAVTQILLGNLPLAAILRSHGRAFRAIEHGHRNTAGLRPAQEHKDEKTKANNEPEQNSILRLQESMGSVRNVFLDRYETLRNRLIVTSATTFSLNEAFLRVIALRHVLYTTRHTTSQPLTPPWIPEFSDTTQKAVQSNQTLR